MKLSLKNGVDCWLHIPFSLQNHCFVYDFNQSWLVKFVDFFNFCWFTSLKRRLSIEWMYKITLVYHNSPISKIKGRLKAKLKYLKLDYFSKKNKFLIKAQFFLLEYILNSLNFSKRVSLWNIAKIYRGTVVEVWQNKKFEKCGHKLCPVKGLVFKLRSISSYNSHFKYIQ